MHPFFQQLQALRLTRPMIAIVSVRSENCDYAPYHASGRNCYRIVGHVQSEDCYYGFWLGLSRDCVDCAFTEKCELCYECVDCRECYNANFCRDCGSGSDLDWCYDCKGCRSCFGCVNLRNKEFHIFNRPYSRDAYFEKAARLRKLHNRLDAPPAEFLALQKTLPRIAMQGFNNENAVGDHIFNSKNCFYGFDVSNQEDTLYMYNSFDVKNCMDCNYTSLGSELCYMCHSGVTLFNSNFCNVCWYSQNLEYCEYVYNSHDCFGCVSRNHAAYEILNQKYAKDEYFKKVARLRDELKADGSYGRWWWESPYGEVKPFPSYMA